MEGSSPSPGTQATSPGWLFVSKEKNMTDLFPGLADVLIVAAMCGTGVLLYAAAVLVRSLK